MNKKSLTIELKKAIVKIKDSISWKSIFKRNRRNFENNFKNLNETKKTGPQKQAKRAAYTRNQIEKQNPFQLVHNSILQTLIEDIDGQHICFHVLNSMPFKIWMTISQHFSIVLGWIPSKRTENIKRVCVALERTQS